MTAPILIPRVRSFSVRCLVAILAALTVSSPLPGYAQNRDAIVASLVALTNALGGPFGDEGPQAEAALRDAETALAAWDTSIERAEHGFATERATVTPAVAARMQAAIGSIYVERGRYADGIRQLVAAAAVSPDSIPATSVQLLAAAQRETGRAADAAETLRAALRRSETDASVASLAAEQGDLPDADLARAIQVLLDTVLDPASVSGPTTRFVSLALLESGNGTEPIFPPARYATAYALIDRGDFAGGFRAVRDAMTQDPLVAASVAQPAAFRAGIDALRRGELQMAISQLRAASAEAPRSSEVHRILGMALWSDGSLDAAAKELNAAIDLNAADERAYLALADVAREGDQQSLWHQTVARAVAAIPGSGQAQWALARLLEEERQDDEALQHFALASAAAPITGEGDVSAAIGRIHHRHLDLDRAAETYLRRVAADPNNPRAHRDLGEVLQAGDLHARAVVEFLTAAWLDRRDADSYARAAQSLLALGRAADSERAAARALVLDPAHVAARFTLAGALTRLGRTDEARQHLETFHRLQQDALDAQRRGMEINGLRIQAQVQAQAGDFRTAAATWREVIAREGATADTQLQLARALAAAGDSAAAAVAYREAIARGGGLPAQRALVELLETSKAPDAAAARAAYEQMKRDRLRQLGTVR